MNIIRPLTLAACAALLLAACTPRPHLAAQDVKSVVGLDMAAVEAKLGRATSVTDAGNSMWWEYDGIVTANGNNDASCHVVFKQGVAVEVKC